jgi:uncharacterized membrane protein YhaH (DUF805 family)
MDYYTNVLKKYAEFDGRAARKEYWMFVLVNSIISIIISILGNIIDFKSLSSIYALAVLLPSLAVLVRRLHDTNRSGWWVLIALVPFIGAIVLIIFAVLDSQPGDNQYGPNPKGETAVPVPPSEPLTASQTQQ